MGKRRTQQERRDTTRHQILEAAVQCLRDHGFTNTTTTQIALKAKVSRGAMLHHFPTKAILMRAVLDYVLEIRLAEFLSRIAQVPKGPKRIEAIIDAFWEVISAESSFIPWLELMVASRSDPELQEIVKISAKEIVRVTDETFRKEFEIKEESNSTLEVAPIFAFALLNGLALRRLVLDDGKHEQVLELLKRFAPLIEMLRAQ